jgi:hypothetical protein
VTRRELETAQTRLADLERERVLTRAGIPADKRGELFARTYEGSLEDPGAVKAAYEDLFGPIGAGHQSQDDPAAGERRIAEAGAAAGEGGNPGSVDFADAIRAAKSVEEVKELIRNAPEGARSQDGYRMRLADD